MRHRNPLIVILWFLAFGLWAQMAMAIETFPVNITPAQVELGTFYGGAKVHVNGTVVSGSNVIVIVRGASGAEVFNKLGRVGPIWVNTGKVTISGAPTLLLVFSSAALETCLNPDWLGRYGLDQASLKQNMQIKTQVADRGRIADDFLALKAKQGTYRTASGSVRLGSPEQDHVPYSLDFNLPRSASPGRYLVTAIECRNGGVAKNTDVDLAVVEVGFPALVSRLAREHAPLYGAIAVVIAMMAGFGIDFIASRVFKRKVAAH